MNKLNDPQITHQENWKCKCVIYIVKFCEKFGENNILIATAINHIGEFITQKQTCQRQN